MAFKKNEITKAMLLYAITGTQEYQNFDLMPYLTQKSDGTFLINATIDNLPIENAYDMKVVINDKLNEKEFSFQFQSSNPILFLSQSGVGIWKKPNFEFRLDIGGKINAENLSDSLVQEISKSLMPYIADEIFPIGSVYSTLGISPDSFDAFKNQIWDNMGYIKINNENTVYLFNRTH